MTKLFGIIYADDILALGGSSLTADCRALVKKAGINNPDKKNSEKNYGVEVYKGVRLAKYVTPNSDALKVFTD